MDHTKIAGPSISQGARLGIERPDDQIRTDILALIMNDPRLDPTGIDIRVESGVVTLSGEVDDDEARYSAQSDAWIVPGVVEIHNFLLLSTEKA